MNRLAESFKRLWWIVRGPDRYAKVELDQLQQHLRTELAGKDWGTGDHQLCISTIEYAAAYAYLDKVGLVDRVETWPSMWDNRTFVPLYGVTLTWV